jgi:hypothetical protein
MWMLSRSWASSVLWRIPPRAGDGRGEILQTSIMAADLEVQRCVLSV